MTTLWCVIDGTCADQSTARANEQPVDRFRRSGGDHVALDRAAAAIRAGDVAPGAGAGRRS